MGTFWGFAKISNIIGVCVILYLFIYLIFFFGGGGGGGGKRRFFVLFDLFLNVPSTIFRLNRDGYSWVEPVLS